MSLNRKITQNTIIHLSGKMISLILGLIAVAVMTRYLGVEGFGYYVTVIAFLQFFGILVDFGLTLTTVQMISEPGRDLTKTMNSIMSFRVITAGLFLALAPIVIWLFPYNIFIKLGVLITVGSFFCITLIQTLTGVFQKKLKMMQVTVAEVVGRVILVGGVIVAAYLGASIYWVFGVITFGSVLNLIIVWFYSKKHVSWKWEVDFSLWKEVFSRTWPIALSISFNLIYLKMDTIILSLTRSPAEVGLYGATYRVVDILTMLPAVFMGIVLPVMTRYYVEKNKEAFQGMMQKAFDALIIFAVPIVVGTMVIARPVMSFVAGQDFVVSGDILKVLILASGAIFVTTLTGYTVVAINKQKKMMWGYLVAAVLTMIGYLYFIPRYGYWGAAWMTVFSEILIMIWTGILVYKVIKFFPRLITFFKTLVPAGVMTAVLYYIRDMHALVLVAVGVVVYFGLLYLFGGIKRESLNELIRLKRD
jgi:O-antigen/teichoic acid export membrane protein